MQLPRQLGIVHVEW